MRDKYLFSENYHGDVITKTSTRFGELTEVTEISEKCAKTSTCFSENQKVSDKYSFSEI